MPLDKATFLEIMRTGVGPEGEKERYSWVELLIQLRQRAEPFTVTDIVKSTSQPRNYVYSHLRGWVETGDLTKIQFGGVNHYLASNQIPTDEE